MLQGISFALSHAQSKPPHEHNVDSLVGVALFALPRGFSVSDPLAAPFFSVLHLPASRRFVRYSRSIQTTKKNRVLLRWTHKIERSTTRAV